MPRKIDLASYDIEIAAEEAAGVLRSDGVILYPTDTLYGMGADSLNREALEKIFAIKGRDEGKPIHSIFASLDAAASYAEITSQARVLAEHFLPGALTLLLRKKSDVPDWATSGFDTFGVRVPKNDFCLALAHAFGKPFTTTSANRSGMLPERNIEKILEQLGAAAKSIDLVIDAGEILESLPSTIVDASGNEIKIVREGAIPADQIWNAFKYRESK